MRVDISEKAMQEHNTLVEFFEKIDYKLLKDQKLELVALVSSKEKYYIDGKQEDALDGILNLLDSLQDTVVKVGIRSKEEVFNLTEE